MKKILVFCLSVILGSASLFAQDRPQRGGDPTERTEQMIKELKLNDDQAVELRKIEKEHWDQISRERESMRNATETDREKMRKEWEKRTNERNERVKHVLTDEQYKQYLEKQRPPQRNRRN